MVVLSLLTQYKDLRLEEHDLMDQVLKLDAMELTKPMLENVLVAGSGIAAHAIT